MWMSKTLMIIGRRYIQPENHGGAIYDFCTEHKIARNDVTACSQSSHTRASSSVRRSSGTGEPSRPLWPLWSLARSRAAPCPLL